MIKQYAITRMIAISSVSRCVPYGLVVLLTNECRDISMTYKWDVGVHLTEYDQLQSTLLSRVAYEGYGYKYPSDLRSSNDLQSISLYFGIGLSEFLIQWWKVSGQNQVLVKSVYESRWDWPLQIIRVNASLYFNLVKFWLG